MRDKNYRGDPEISQETRKGSGERHGRHRTGRRFTLRPRSVAHIKNSRELEISGTGFFLPRPIQSCLR